MGEEKNDRLEPFTEKGNRELAKSGDLLKDLEELTGSGLSYSTAPGPFEKKAVYLLIDCSASMYGIGIDQACNGALQFMEEAEKLFYETGLIAFSSEPKLLFKAGSPPSDLKGTINQMTAAGSTDMAGALGLAHDMLRGAAGEKAIFLVTDGMPNDSFAAVRAANAIKEDGIDLLVLGAGDADHQFLIGLASKYELTVKTEIHLITHTMHSMVKLLPGPRE